MQVEIKRPHMLGHSLTLLCDGTHIIGTHNSTAVIKWTLSTRNFEDLLAALSLRFDSHVQRVTAASLQGVEDDATLATMWLTLIKHGVKTPNVDEFIALAKRLEASAKANDELRARQENDSTMLDLLTEELRELRGMAEGNGDLKEIGKRAAVKPKAVA